MLCVAFRREYSLVNSENGEVRAAVVVSGCLVVWLCWGCVNVCVHLPLSPSFFHSIHMLLCCLGDGALPSHARNAASSSCERG